MGWPGAITALWKHLTNQPSSSLTQGKKNCHSQEASRWEKAGADAPRTPSVLSLASQGLRCKWSLWVPILESAGRMKKTCLTKEHRDVITFQESAQSGNAHSARRARFCWEEAKALACCSIWKNILFVGNKHVAWVSWLQQSSFALPWILIKRGGWGFIVSN